MYKLLRFIIFSTLFLFWQEIHNKYPLHEPRETASSKEAVFLPPFFLGLSCFSVFRLLLIFFNNILSAYSVRRLFFISFYISSNHFSLWQNTQEEVAKMIYSVITFHLLY